MQKKAAPPKTRERLGRAGAPAAAFFSVQEGGGAVFVETSNLDGETNLKAKQARSSSH